MTAIKSLWIVEEEDEAMSNFLGSNLRVCTMGSNLYWSNMFFFMQHYGCPKGVLFSLIAIGRCLLYHFHKSF